MSGAWSGSYVYAGELEPVAFEVEIRDSGGKLSGVIAEPSMRLPNGTAHSIMSGSHGDGCIEFVKIYDAVEEFPDPVHYQGTLDTNECEISGIWSIRTMTGGFIMTRPKARAAEIEQAESVTV